MNRSGRNLKFAGYVFLFDRWGNPAVEERINRTLEDKRRLSQLILSGAQGLNSSKGLNQEELFGLFNLQVPAKLRKSA